MLHAVEPLDGRHALGPGAQLAHRLWPPQEEHGQDRGLRGVEPERLVEDVAITDDGAPVGGQHEADQALVLQIVEGALDDPLSVADDRLTIRGLVARRHQGVERERVLLGGGESLFHQRAEDPGARRAQRHGSRA